MSLWWCEHCCTVNPNGDYHCPKCRRSMVFATLSQAHTLVTGIDPEALRQLVHRWRIEAGQNPEDHEAGTQYNCADELAALLPPTRETEPPQ